MKFIILILKIFLFYLNINAHVTLNNPTSGQSFNLGEQIMIEWTATVDHGSGTWKLEYTNDDGANWITFKNSIPKEKTEYTWYVPYSQTDKGGIRVTQVNDNFGNYTSSAMDLIFGTSTSITDESLNLYEYKLNNAYPNPFNNSTVISYQLPFQSNVQLVIYDLTGKEIEILVKQIQPAGMYKYRWDAAGRTSGIYIAIMKSQNHSFSKKLILLK
jgi:type IX secretion system substrate protein